MNETITRSNIDARVENLNRRFGQRGSLYRWEVEQHSGQTHLYRIVDETGARHSHITAGTKRAIADFLHAAMVAVDDYNA